MRIKNSKVAGQIYETDDYSIFVKLPSNRELLSRRLKMLITSFSIKEIMNPIVVNKYYQIIDGQGRFEAKKTLRLPIQYIVDEDADIEDCRRMNAYNAPWTVKDYAKSLAEDGNDDCRRLIAVCDELGISLKRCLRLSNHMHNPGHRVGTAFEVLLKLQFNEDDVAEVKEVWQKTMEIKECLGLTKRINEAFCSGVKVMTENADYDHEGMLRRCKKLKNSFSMASNLEDMLKEFSRIYNNERTVAKRLYFEDYMRNRGYNVRNYKSKCSDTNVSTLKEK